MKKLMIAGVVGLCAAVTFAESIESQNVVGYQNINVPNGYIMLTPTFENVDASTHTIQDLKPQNAPGDGSVTLQTMSDDGSSWVGEYQWWTEADMGMPDGWYEPNSGELATDILVSGKAAMIYSPVAGVTMLVSGSVATSSVSNPCAVGYTMSGNNTPVNCSVGELKVTLDDGTAAPGDGSITLQTMSEDGSSWVGEYQWWTEADMGMPDGWYEPNSGELASETLTPGLSTMVYSPSSAIKIVVPAPM